MTINKSLFSSLPQFPTLRLGSCLHTLVRVFTNQLPTSLGSCFQEPFISSLRYGSCPHKPITHITWFVSSRTNYPYPMVRVSTNHLHTPHSPWFMFLQTNYSLHTPWFVSSLRLGSCLHEPITHSPGSYLHEPINIKLFKTLTKLTLNVTSKTYFKTRKRKIG